MESGPHVFCVRASVRACVRACADSSETARMQKASAAQRSAAQRSAAQRSRLRSLIRRWPVLCALSGVARAQEEAIKAIAERPASFAQARTEALPSRCGAVRCGAVRCGAVRCPVGR